MKDCIPITQDAVVRSKRQWYVCVVIGEVLDDIIVVVYERMCGRELFYYCV